MDVKLKRPETLKEGREYLWQESTGSANGRSPQQVTFVAYDPCPAFVIVQDEAGRRWRCPREVIFALETIDREGLFSALAGAIATSSQALPPAERHLPRTDIPRWRAAPASSKTSS